METSAITTVPSNAYRWLVLTIVVATSTLYAMTILVVSVVLPQMQGTFSATSDQISWAMTANILGTAVITPISGWLASRFGWRTTMLVCQGGFSVTTIFCGYAESLETLVLFRALQGGFGAPLVPLSQAIILSVFPKQQHNIATSVFGMGVVIGPIIGPILGGFLSELYNWRWAFFMLVPFCAVSFIGLWVALRDGGRQENTKFAWAGFASLAIALSCLQLVLDRGQRLDWFDSVEIMIETFIGFTSFIIFLCHNTFAKFPLFNFRFLTDRNYSLGLLTVLVYGMLNFTPMVMLPPLLKNIGGYPDSIIGYLLAWRGTGAVFGFFLANWISRFDLRIGIILGYLLQGWSGWVLMNIGTNISMLDITITSCAQGLSVGFIWVPLTLATFKNIDSSYMAETSTVYHLLRNIGSSIFISLSVITVIRTSTINFAQLTEFINPYNETLTRMGIDTKTGYTMLPKLAQINADIINQAQFIGYLNAFGLYSITCLIILPVILFLKSPNQKFKKL